MGLKKLRYRDRVDSNRPRKGEEELPAFLTSESSTSLKPVSGKMEKFDGFPER